MTASSRVMTLGLAALLAALPACSGSQEPGPTALPPLTSTPTPSPTPSSTPTASATRTPGQFDEATQAEAEAFVREFWETVNDGLSGATSAEHLKSYYDQTCGICAEIQADVAALQRAQQRAEGADQKVLRADYDTNLGMVALVRVVIQAQPGTVVNRAGESVRRLRGARPVDFVFNVVRTDGDWLIQHVVSLGSVKS